MDKFKIELFEKEYNRPFPIYRTLSKMGGKRLQNEIARRYHITLLIFEYELDFIQTVYPETDTIDNFRLIDTLQNMGITPMNELFINWYRFEHIDVMNTVDLDKYFDAIWFHIADDIDLFDSSLQWIVTVSHDGLLSYIME